MPLHAPTRTQVAALIADCEARIFACKCIGADVQALAISRRCADFQFNSGGAIDLTDEECAVIGLAP